MHLHPLSFIFLLLLVAGAAALHGFRGCAVREFSLWPRSLAARDCTSPQRPAGGVVKPGRNLCQIPPTSSDTTGVCTYNRSRHMTARLPGCQPNVSPLYHYPMALHCHCAVCSTQDTECETF